MVYFQITSISCKTTDEHLEGDVNCDFGNIEICGYMDISHHSRSWLRKQIENGMSKQWVITCLVHIDIVLLFFSEELVEAPLLGSKD